MFLTSDDIALLRRFEPVLRFNIGEQFYPMDVDRYVTACRLSIQRPNDVAEELVPRGQLTIDRLVEPRDEPPGSVLFLHFVDPLPPLQVAEFRRTSSLREFQAGRGRLARVGILARLGDLVFSLSLLLRGKVPGGSAAAAALRYQALQAEQARFCYYGRVMREHGYIALQYWFFYAFNDWRSSFNGVNDHEADWEMITVYLVEDGSGVVQPRWLAYSSHEFEGDDLRRRWDDPEITRIGEHPVVYVAAGAHANHFAPGEYLPTAELPYTTWLQPAWRAVQRFWQVTLRQSSQGESRDAPGAIRIPFVEYARGDGQSIGPGQPHTWELRLLQATEESPAPPWIDEYHGLWGLYTGDPLAGEDGPARPKHRRDGSISNLWYDPVGWCGLAKVPPPARAPAALEDRRRQLQDERHELERQMSDLAVQLTGLSIEIEAVERTPHLRSRQAEIRRRIRDAAAEMDALKARRADGDQALEQLNTYAERLEMGDFGPPRAHLRVPQIPASTEDLRLSRVAETWSAISIGVLLVGTVLLVLLARNWEVGLLAMFGVYAFLEALFRRRVQNLVRTVVIGLAIVTTLVLAFEFFWPVVGLLAVLSGLLIIVENVRELRT